MVLVWERLQVSAIRQLAAIAAKSLKEVRYHLRHARLAGAPGRRHRRIAPARRLR
jgi:hypothetical protein